MSGNILLGPSWAQATETGEFSVSNQVIPAGGTWMKTIPLGAADFVTGDIMLYAPASIAYTNNRRHSALIRFTSDVADAMAQAAAWKSYSLYGYIFFDHWIRGFKYSDDSKLSAAHFGNASVHVQIDSCRINGAQIELVFRNTYGGATRGVTVNGVYRVYR